MKIAVRLAVLCSLVVVCAFFAGSAEAQEVEQVGQYYSNATYTTIVGGKIYDCCGGVVTWGQYTSYQIWEPHPCGECFPNDPCEGDPYCSASFDGKQKPAAKETMKYALTNAHGASSRCSRTSI
jgi:hypothetical protein